MSATAAANLLAIGVDPGMSGAVAFLPPTGAPWAVRADETPRDILDALTDALRGHHGDVFAVIERVGAMPRQGVASTFKFGRSFGMLEALLVAARVPYDLVTPAKWQRVLGCRTGGDKRVTKAAAQRLFPGMTITHRVADALLLGEYARRVHAGRAGGQHAAGNGGGG